MPWNDYLDESREVWCVMTSWEAGKEWLFKLIKTYPQLVIYTEVFLNESVGLSWEEDPTRICAFVSGKVMPKSKVASDRILMDVSDAMENIKNLICDEANHSPAQHVLYPVELGLPKAEFSRPNSPESGLHIIQ